MSAPTIDRTDTEVAASGPAGALTGTSTLVRFQLRRDRVRLPAWTAGFGLFIVYLAAALPTVAETEEELASTTQLFGDPVGRLLTGPGYGFDEPTFERLVAGGYGLYLLILVALMSIMLVVRHTRIEEQTGRAELVRASVVGPYAVLTATALVALITNVVAAAVVFAAMVTVGGWGAGGSLLMAVGLAATGMVFAGVASVTAQLSEYSRAATGSASAVLGVAFLLRAGGDMAEPGGTLLSWLSPLGWAQQTAPFVLDRWWPLLLAAGFAALTTGAGFVLSTRRDLGASLVAVRPGRAHGSRALGTPLGLATRLHRGNAIGWSIGLGLTALAYGAYADALLTAVGDLPEMFTELFGAEDVLAGYLAYIAVFMAYLAAAYTVTAVQSVRGEETSGRAEPVLATPVGRVPWMATNVGVIAGAVLGVMLVSGLATGAGAALVTGEAHHLGDMVAAHLNQVPAVWVVMSVAVLFLGVWPRAIGVAWAFVGYGLFAGTFAGMLELPRAVIELSPFEHAAELPVEPFAIGPPVTLTLLAVLLVAVGMVGYRRRGIGTA